MNPAYDNTVFLLSEVPTVWPNNFAIITGHNPMDQKLTDSENIRRNQQLADWAEPKIFIKLIGSSPDHSHKEASFAFKCSLNEAIKIGKQFNQRAIFYVRKGNLELVECNSGKNKQLGKFIERLVPLS
jgi:hypothetical protein